MKVLSPGLGLLLFAVCAAAQTPAPSDVTVLQNKWRIELYNPALDKDPLAASKQRQDEERKQKAAARENENRVRQGENPLPPVVSQSTPETGKRRLIAMYIYELKVRNTGRKEIRTLTWEYVFSEPDTKQEVGRLGFVSKVSMKPGTTRQIVVHSDASPTGTVDATKAGKKPSDQYSEKIVIKSIEYGDGSVWP